MCSRRLAACAASLSAYLSGTDSCFAGEDTVDEERAVQVAERELADAIERQTKARDKATAAQNELTDLQTNGVAEARSAEGANNSNDPFSGLGKSLWDGLLETICLDGSLFSNPFEWPTMKSIMARGNFMGGLLSGESSPGAATSTGNADAGGLLGALTDTIGLNVPSPGALNPGADINPAVHSGTGSAPGPSGAQVDNSININGNVGMDPSAVNSAVNTE